MQETEDMTLMYLGSGLMYGGLLLALIAGIIGGNLPQSKGFKYGVFFHAGNMVAAPLGGLAMVCLFYEFLSPDIAHLNTIVVAVVVIAELIAYKALKFRGKALWWITNIPYILLIYTIPFAIWNIVYYYKVYKPGNSTDSPTPSSSNLVAN
ncbi:hypothetical protein [Cerasicoccus frondis]|uniref:hypothetical protein n=1 Tax=Cerasicoccus frondis TaxID=490090 RepID=UPI002852BA43|nr:hypothetical protein [Cerasicoccus frondis]